MIDHDLLILMVSSGWLITNFLGATFTFRRLYNLRRTKVTAPFREPIFKQTVIPEFDRSNSRTGNNIARLPCLLILDTSASMTGERISAVNLAMGAFVSVLLADQEAKEKVDVGMVTFGPVRRLREFQRVSEFEPPILAAGGDTPMGAAIIEGLQMLDERKEFYRRETMTYYRPLIFLFTDGVPTDPWEEAAERVHIGQQSRSFNFVGIGLEGANMEVLRKICAPSIPQMVREPDLSAPFGWLSASLSFISHSRVGDQVSLPDLNWNSL